jgi:chromosomal replication initiation ATPase DnaA
MDIDENVNYNYSYAEIYKHLHYLSLQLEMIMSAANEITKTLQELSKKNLLIGPVDQNFIINTIKNSACQYYMISIPEFSSASRKEECVKARQITVYLLKHDYLQKITLKTLGNVIHRVHATVLHAFNVINESKETKGALWYDFLEIKDSCELIINKYINEKQQKL